METNMVSGACLGTGDAIKNSGHNGMGEPPDWQYPEHTFRH